MKFIGKEAQKKIDLQIQDLKEQVKNLQETLRGNDYSLLGVTNELAELKPKHADLLVKKESLESQVALELVEIASLNSQLAQIRQELKDANAEKSTELTQVKSDADLLLEQLHQVQEELETVFLREQAVQSQLTQLKPQIETLQKEKSALATDRDAKAKQLTEALAAKDALAKEKAQFITARDAQTKQLSDLKEAKESVDQEKSQLSAQKTELEKDNGQLLSQLHTVQEELETVFLREQSVQTQLPQVKAQLDALQKEKSQLATSRDAQTKQLTELKSAKDASDKEKAALVAELASLKVQLTAQQRDLKQENDLMLLQLHQVQEELEHYFLEHEKLQKTEQAQTQRWQRLESRLPNYLDYEAITPITVDSFSETPTVGWRVTECTLDGQVLPELEFVTCLVNGKAGIRMGDIELIPRALVVPNFRSMTTSQWRKMRAAATVIEYFFATQTKAATALEDFDFGFWKQTLLPLVADIRALPNVFRYNTVQIKRELIHSAYEHLWLVFTGASYGRQAWPKFEMRLGASNIQPGAFSKFPKLEFPRIDGKTSPFDSWFEESWDDFGGKLELRFDLTKYVSDVGVWSKVTAQDQALLVSLISLLPLVVQQMQSNKLAISRPWADWATLVNGIIETLRKLMTPPKPAVVDPPKPAMTSQETLPKLSPTNKASKPKAGKTVAAKKTAASKKPAAKTVSKNA